MEELKVQRARLEAKILELEKRLSHWQRRPQETGTEEAVSQELLDLERWKNGDFRRLLEQITVEGDGTVLIRFQDFTRQEEPHCPFVGS